MIGTIDPTSDRPIYKPGETVGKSKLEKETGTVNDRIFEVLPNYGTVENAEDLPALYSWPKISAGNRRGLRLGRLSLQRCSLWNRAGKE